MGIGNELRLAVTLGEELLPSLEKLVGVEAKVVETAIVQSEHILSDALKLTPLKGSTKVALQALGDVSETVAKTKSLPANVVRGTVLPGAAKIKRGIPVEHIPHKTTFFDVEGTVEDIGKVRGTGGKMHQDFVIKVSNTSPCVSGTVVPGGANPGKLLKVNNNLYVGAKAELQPGQKILVRGAVYERANGTAGIHWTHHGAKYGDAGFILTETGAYE